MGALLQFPTLFMYSGSSICIRLVWICSLLVPLDAAAYGWTPLLDEATVLFWKFGRCFWARVNFH